ncbi:hypothetical protein BJ166DRAFT_589156 [Pestalotiopsis sp. NC0098]|nr:hypothetical protein BJ166DRAFT_589156 [Pestalotiopsis sp. NC0098]
MKTSTLFAALGAILAFGIQTATATCYKHGPDWPERSLALNVIREACNSPNGTFAGKFNPLETRRLCHGSKGAGWLFEVQNLNAVGTYDLDDSECVMRLSNEIVGCKHGGESNIASWRFRADTGEC